MDPKLNERLRALLAEVLEVTLAPGEVTRASLAQWDSLNHLRVVVAVEEEFSLRLEVDEVTSIASLADLETVVAGKLAAAA
ncbi:MAG TPA: acyl carrier protein [Myxococcales bacterium]|jgi:acyl carrier protein|nr:acyl carrier protein [Myxococcales bacterium]